MSAELSTVTKESFPKTLFCLIEAVLVEQRNPQKKMSFRGVWVAIESAANQALGLLRFPPVAEDQAVGKLRVGIMAATQIDSLLEGFDGLVLMLQTQLDEADVVNRFIIAGIPCRGLGEVLEARGKIFFGQTFEAAVVFVLGL